MTPSARTEHLAMRQSFYRKLILLFAIWGVLCIPTVLLPFLSRSPRAEDFRLLSLLLAIGYALLSVSVIGLWNLRLWGFVVLLLGTFLVMISYPGGIHLHLFCILLTLFRYHQAKRETLLETSPAEQQLP